MSTNALDQLIASQQEKLTAAEHVVKDIKLKIETLIEARDAVNGAATNATPANTNATPANTTQRRGREPVKQRRGRGLSPAWMNVIEEIVATGKAGADIDQIAAFCEAAGITTARTTLRSQLFNYVKRGRLARTNGGRYTAPA
jgi:hypothetical protein